MNKPKRKLSKRHKEKISKSVKLAHILDPTLKDKIRHIGNKNGRYVDGHTMVIKYCVECNKKISYKATRCRVCAMKKVRKKYSRLNILHTEKTKKIIGKKSKAKFTKEYLIKQRETFEKLGLWIPLKDIEPYKLYCKKANWKENMVNYFSSYELKMLKKRGLYSPKNSKGMVRDHRYSRFSGFKNKIPTILLRHPVNCQLISHGENVSKAHKGSRYEDGDSITLQKLFKLINGFNKKWNEQEECLKMIKEYKEKVKMTIGGKL